jgi:hypothetical protein
MKIDWSFAMIRILFTTVNVKSTSTLRKNIHINTRKISSSARDREDPR